MARRISTTTKQKLINQYGAGVSVRQLCQKYHIPRSTIYSWIKNDYQPKKQDGLITPRALNTLRNEVKRYENIITILKTVGTTAKAPIRERLVALTPLYGQYPVHQLCDALDVPRGTFYNHIRRNKGDESWYVKRNTELKAVISELYYGSRQIYGIGKIRALLVKRGYKVSQKYVAKLMQEMGLQSIRCSSPHRGRGKIPPRHNIIKQNFRVEEPNRVWVSDITECIIKGRKYYICAVIDLFARKLLTMTVGPNSSTHLVTKSLHAALSSRQITPGYLTLHTDRGSAYTSYTMERNLKKYQITHSYSRPSTPYDNAVIESFFNTLKREEIYRTNYRSERDFIKSLQTYMITYNSVRPHEALAYATPNEVEQNYYQEQQCCLMF